MTELNQLRWQSVDPLKGWVLHNTPAWAQQAFRFDEDDAAEGSATPYAPENTAVTIKTNTTFRLRVEIEEINNGSTNNADLTLQYNLNGGGWNGVTTTSSVVQLTTSSFLTDGQATSDTLTTSSATFVAGAVEIDGSGTSIAFNGLDHTEVVYVLTIIDADVTSGDSIDFRVLGDGTTLTYNQTPTASIPITVVGSGASTTVAGNAGQVSGSYVEQGSTATTVSTPSAGGIVYPGSTAASVSTANSGSPYVVVFGSNVSVSSTANTGNTFKEIDYQGTGAATSSVALGGSPNKTVLGAAAVVNDVASAGQDGGDYVEPGGQAFTTDSANIGVADKVIIVEGSLASVSIAAISGEPLKYIIEGLLDEWGRWHSGRFDEDANRVLPVEGLNERGDWTDATRKLDLSKVFGVQAVTTDVAHEGTILSANVTNGSQVALTDTPGDGQALLEINISGSSSTTTETANGGALSQGLVVSGAQASETNVAVVGSHFTAIDLLGSSATTTVAPNDGDTFVEVDVGGATATTNEQAHGTNTGLFVWPGEKGLVSSVPTAGVILLPSFIRVQGGKANTVDLGITGSIGASNLVVTGIRRLTVDHAIKGVALGGQEVIRIMLDKQIRDKVLVSP